MVKKMLAKVAQAGALLVLVCGCAGVDYTGQVLGELDASRGVTFYRTLNEMPQNKYTLIGRGKITFRDRADIYDFRREAEKKARKIGADAYCIEFIDRYVRGVHAARNEEFGAPVRRPPRRDKEFGQEVPLRGEGSGMTYVYGKVLFFRNSKEVADILGKER